VTSVRYFVDGIPPRPNELRREHWSVRSKSSATFREASKLLALDAVRRSVPIGHPVVLPIDPAALFLTFVLAQARGDLDGLVAAAKPIVDGLKDAGVIADDNVARMPRLIASWSRGTRVGVWVSVQRAEP
jgi:hypothetical protein